MQNCVCHFPLSQALGGTMRFLRILKRVAAVLILISFFLPLSRCTRATEHADDAGKVATSTVEHTDYSAMSIVEPELGGVIILFLFVWPLFLQLVLASRFQHFERSYLVLVGEIILLTATCMVAFQLASMGEIRYGAIVFAVAAVVYGSTTLFGLGRRLWKQ